MATIPIRKLNDGVTNYYPLSVGESVVTTHKITLGQNIGDFKKGEVLYPVTTFDYIIKRLLTGTGSGSTTIDNKTITTDNNSNLQVNLDNDTLVYDSVLKKVKVDTSDFAFLNKDQTFVNKNTFDKPITFSESELPPADRNVLDRHSLMRFGSSPDDELIELPEEGEITSGKYQLTADRDHGIIIAEGADVELHIAEDVTVTASTLDGIYIQSNAVLRLFNSGTIKCLSTGVYCTIYNEGTAYIKGGTYEKGDGNYNIGHYYCILNHGKLLELWDVTAKKNLTKQNSSLMVNGYYNYRVGENRQYIDANGKGWATPKLIIHSGEYYNENITGTIKNDGGGTTIIYGGTFDGAGHDILQNTGVLAEIHGGIWYKSGVQTDSLIYNGLEHQTPSSGIQCQLLITGGTFTFNGDYWLNLSFRQTDTVYPKITGGVFGPSTSYALNDEIIANFEDLVDPQCISIKRNNNIHVYYISDLLNNLNGIKFSDGNIVSTSDGLYIKNVKNVNDETSAVSKQYVDRAINRSKIFDKKSFFNVHNEYSAFEVYATSENIVAGTIDDKTNLEYKVDVPASMSQVIQIRTMHSQNKQNVIIDWGDGSLTELADCNSITKYRLGKDDGVFYDTMTDEKETMAYCSHVYTAPGRYIVKIWGNTYWGLRCDYPAYNLISRIFDNDLPINPCVVDFCSFANGNLRLQKIQLPKYYEGLRNIENTTDMFKDCKNLINVSGFNRFIFGKTPYAPVSMFYGCTNLKTCDVRLSQTSLVLSTANSGFYKYCENLESDLVTLLPSCGFSGRVVSMSGVFNGCKKLTCSDWDLVASILWDDTSKVWKNTANCFSDCDDEFRENIPEEWGGKKRKPFKGRTFVIQSSEDLVSAVQESLDALHIEKTIETDDDLYSAVRDIMTELNMDLPLRNDDELVEAVRQILLELGAKEVIIRF